MFRSHILTACCLLSLSAAPCLAEVGFNAAGVVAAPDTNPPPTSHHGFPQRPFPHRPPSPPLTPGVHYQGQIVYVPTPSSNNSQVVIQIGNGSYYEGYEQPYWYRDRYRRQPVYVCSIHEYGYTYSGSARRLPDAQADAMRTCALNHGERQCRGSAISCEYQR